MFDGQGINLERIWLSITQDGCTDLNFDYTSMVARISMTQERLHDRPHHHQGGNLPLYLQSMWLSRGPMTPWGPSQNVHTTYWKQDWLTPRLPTEGQKSGGVCWSVCALSPASADDKKELHNGTKMNNLVNTPLKHFDGHRHAMHPTTSPQFMLWQWWICDVQTGVFEEMKFNMLSVLFWLFCILLFFCNCSVCKQSSDLLIKLS